MITQALVQLDLELKFIFKLRLMRCFQVIAPALVLELRNVATKRLPRHMAASLCRTMRQLMSPVATSASEVRCEKEGRVAPLSMTRPQPNQRTQITISIRARSRPWHQRAVPLQHAPTPALANNR